jgi:hypothetical protein
MDLKKTMNVSLISYVFGYKTNSSIPNHVVYLLKVFIVCSPIAMFIHEVKSCPIPCQCSSIVWMDDNLSKLQMISFGFLDELKKEK